MRVLFAAMVVPVAIVAAVVAAPVPKAAPVPPPTEEQFKASRNNLEQVALAFHVYAAANKDNLPGNIYSKDGKPLLSWRVAILPYIEHLHVYNLFKLDEPWDSDHNKKLIEKMPKVYAPVRVEVKAGETFYQTFTGDRAVFGDMGPRYNIGNIPDGNSSTALVVEAGSPVSWTKPDDIPFDAKKPLPKLGGLFDGDFHVGLFDGSVILVKKDFDQNELKNFILPADGNKIDFRKLEK